MTRAFSCEKALVLHLFGYAPARPPEHLLKAEALLLYAHVDHSRFGSQAELGLATVVRTFYKPCMTQYTASVTPAA